MEFNIDNIKKMITELAEGRAYYEEAVFGLTEHFDGLQVEELLERHIDTRRWETDTEHIYKLISADGGTIFVGVVNTEGNTEMQEGQGITDVYEVAPKEIITTVYERV